MTNFDLKNFLSSNREYVITQFTELQSEKFYSGISLKEFMIKILGYMQENNANTEKRANEMFKRQVMNVYNNNVKIGVDFNRDKVLAEKYKATAYMAIV